MGAIIRVEGKTACIEGVDHLDACSVTATDLRAGAALIIAGIVANGETDIHSIQHIDRGYEKIEEKFRQIGANITRVTVEE